MCRTWFLYNYEIRQLAVSSTDYIVDTQLCKLRNIPRLYPIFTEFPNFMMSRLRVFYMYLYWFVETPSLVLALRVLCNNSTSSVAAVHMQA